VGVEDLALGFILKALGFHVEPLSVLENAETPTHFATLWNQKVNWFLGPLGYFFYWRLIPSTCKPPPLLVAALSVQGVIFDAANWLLAGPLIVAFLILSYYKNLLGVGLLAYWLYVSTPLLGLLWLWNRLPRSQFPRPPRYRMIISILMYPIVPILHSAPAFQGCWLALKLLFGHRILRHKTERL